MAWELLERAGEADPDSCEAQGTVRTIRHEKWQYLSRRRYQHDWEDQIVELNGTPTPYYA
jgi:hypothetical protein